MNGGAVAARLARREVVRRPWRSLVVAFLVIVPASLLTLIIVTARSTDLDHEQLWDRQHGAEDAILHVPPAVELPGGTRTLEVASLSPRIRTINQVRAWPLVTDRDLDHEMSTGLVQRLEGRTPTTSGEVFLTRRLARRLDVGLGDELRLERPTPAAFTVVGIGEWGLDLDAHVMVLGATGGADPVASLVGDEPGRATLLDLPEPAAHDRDLLRALGVLPGDARVLPTEWDIQSSIQATVVWTWVGAAVAFTILGVVISAAFAVTARRQLLLIGQLMGNGASLTVLRATLCLQGTVVGLVGSALGVVVAVTSLTVFQGAAEEILDRRLEQWVVRPGDLVPIVVIATAASTIAALIPARTAVRTSPLEALAGRRPLGPYPRRLVVRGAVAAAIGLFLLAVATAGASRIGVGGRDDNPLFVLTGIIGSVTVILGTCAMAPALVSAIGPLASSLRGTARLAARSIARQRSRTGAVVAAIAVVAAGAVAGTSAWLTAEARERDRLPEIPADVVSISYLVGADVETAVATPPSALLDDVLAVVPGGRVVVTERAVPPGADGPFSPTTFFVVDDAVADILRLDDGVRRALERGDAVHAGASWLGIGYVPEREAEIGQSSRFPIYDARGNELATVESIVPDVTRAIWSPSFLPMLSAGAADDLGLVRAPGPVLVQGDRSFSADERDRLADLALDAHDEYLPAATSDLQVSQIWIQHPSELDQPSGTTVTAVLLAIATVATLAVVGLGLSLSAAETRDERDVLAAVGAPPRALRRLAAAKAITLTLTGIVVGVPLGFIPTALVVRVASVNRYESLSAIFPWAQVALLFVVVPIVAAVVTLAASAVALRVRPVTASSMAFD